jgi:uncharacterized protein YukE
MPYFDENLNGADEALITIKQALAALEGSGANRLSDPVTEAIGRMDWNEKEVGIAAMHVDNIATTSAGAGAAANTDKAIEAIDGVLRATSGGWFGEAADRFSAYAYTVRNNLQNFKEELEQWARDVAAEEAEQPISASIELKRITRDILKKSEKIAKANEDAAQTVLSTVVPREDDPHYVDARNRVYEAGTEVTKMIDIKVGEAEQSVFPLVNKHNTATVVIRDPRYATPVTLHSEFAMNKAAMIAAVEESLVCLAMLRDAKNNLEAAEGTTPYFGANEAAMNASAAWVATARHRLDDVDELIDQVAAMSEGLDLTKSRYQKADDESAEELQRSIDDDFESTVLSGDGTATLPIEQKDPSGFADAHANVEDVLHSGWEGQGDLPDVVPPGSILGDDPGDGAGEEPL